MKNQEFIAVIDVGNSAIKLGIVNSASHALVEVHETSEFEGCREILKTFKISSILYSNVRPGFSEDLVRPEDQGVQVFDAADYLASSVITFRDLNNAANSSVVTDVNSNGYIDGGDLLGDPAWEDGVDTDGNGLTDDLIGWDFHDDDNDPMTDKYTINGVEITFEQLLNRWNDLDNSNDPLLYTGYDGADPFFFSFPTADTWLNGPFRDSWCRGGDCLLDGDELAGIASWNF